MEDFFNKGNKAYNLQGPDQVAVELIQRLPPFESSSVVLDLACGPAVATRALLAQCASKGISPPKIHAIDNSQGMIDNVNEMKEREKWETVHAEVMDGATLSGIEDNYFTLSIGALAVVATGARGMYRTLKPGGTAVATNCSNQPLLKITNAVRDKVHPGLPSFPPGFPIEACSKEWLPEAMKQDGFKDPKVESYTINQTFNSLAEALEEWKNPFYSIAKNDLSKEEGEKFDEILVETLKERKDLSFDIEICCVTAVK